MLIATFVRDKAVSGGIAAALGASDESIRARTWSGLDEIVREQPVTATVVDLGALSTPGWASSPIAAFRRRFPHQGLVVLVPRRLESLSLFRLGRGGVSDLLLLPVDDLRADLSRVVRRSVRGGVAAVAARALSPFLPGVELRAVRHALDDVRRTRDAEGFSRHVGYSRPFLSQRFRRWGLPSVGRMLLWCRVLHAAQWLTAPGRSGESVSRQLDYANGAVFRRALRGCVGVTPSELVARGGLGFVLRTFMREHGFVNPPGYGFQRAVAPI